MAKKLLVADDSLTIQKVIRLALSNEGYEIQAISNGADAIQQLSLFRPDLVLIDVSLPGKNAFEVKQAVNSMPDLQFVRFVLMSSAFEKVDESLAQEVLFHGRLTKPFDPAHLRQVLQTVLADGATPPPPMPMPPSAPSEPETEYEEISLDPPLPTGGSRPPKMPPRPPEKPTPKPPANPFIDLPTVPPPTQEEVHALWDDHEGLPSDKSNNTSPELTPPPPPASIPESTDIRQLTESTIRMSGLNEFDWDIQEPSLKPLPNLSDTGETHFNFEHTPPKPPEMPPRISTEKEEPTKKIIPPQAPPIAAAAIPRNVGGSEIEAIVREQVQSILSKFAQDILPQVAERVIKEEIHRLLNEQP